MTERTKKCRAKRRFFHIVSILLAYGPILGYLIAGFTISDNSGKITLTICSIVGIVIALINLLAKYHIRSTIWIILLGIYMVMKDIQMLIIITAITTILDEFIFTPLYHKYKELTVINKEIDRR